LFISKARSTNTEAIQKGKPIFVQTESYEPQKTDEWKYTSRKTNCWNTKEKSHI